ncbi:MAG: dTDP-4-amino-4,6-dideoxygalactose transaminase [Nitrospirae bacterium GWC2_56_14]|nr:MAG: dTDP-4-amino-4,6-dideoxygalactose transaminase [Nitrospirae bacterium GWC2_56_14]
MIPFNKPFIIGPELDYIRQAVMSGKISGDGLYTKQCQLFFESRYHFKKTLLTTSCTDALEMAAILLDIEDGDEVIVPSFTFVSTANAFVLRGAKIVFADSEDFSPNIDIDRLEPLITDRTRAIVPVHYAGIACNMGPLLDLAKRHSFSVVEDAAQAVDSYYRGKPLGSLGALSAFSFHETKNIISGEGGMLVVNDDRHVQRAEIIREKGTNRSSFFRGEVDKYGWVDIGSSFLPSEIIAAFLYAQLEHLDAIQTKRKRLWDLYFEHLTPLAGCGHIRLPYIPEYATNNAHMFYILCDNITERSALIAHLRKHDIMAVFHYLPLQKSPFYKDKHDGRELPNADRYSNCLLRLPLYYELHEKDVESVSEAISIFFKTRRKTM